MRGYDTKNVRGINRRDLVQKGHTGRIRGQIGGTNLGGGGTFTGRERQQLTIAYEREMLDARTKASVFSIGDIHFFWTKYITK